MILTRMPGAADYLLLISIIAFAISFVGSFIAIGIIVAVKKDKKTTRDYFILWLKILLISFAAIMVPISAFLLI